MKSQYAGEIASAFYPLTDRYVGVVATVLMEILIVTGSFACTMSFYNTGARYLFALGREGVLPGALAHTSTRRSPATASMTVTVIVALYCLAFVIYDPSTEGALLKLGTWSPLLGVLGHPRGAGAGLDRDHPLLPAPPRVRSSTGGPRSWPRCSASPRWRRPACCSSSTATTWPARPTPLYIKILPWVVLAVFVAGMAVAWSCAAAPPTATPGSASSSSPTRRTPIRPPTRQEPQA